MEDDDGGFEQVPRRRLRRARDRTSPFEWVLTGRHDTLRADGNSVEGAAFGGPIFYGHDATGSGNDDAKHTDNVWWYQGSQANKIFATLDDKQKAQALVDKAEPDAPRVDPAQGRQARRRRPGRRRPRRPAEADGPAAPEGPAPAPSAPSTSRKSRSASTTPAAPTSSA